MNVIKVPLADYLRAASNGSLGLKHFDDFIFHNFILSVDCLGISSNQSIQRMNFVVEFDPSEKIFLITVNETVLNQKSTYKCQWFYKNDITHGCGVMIPEGDVYEGLSIKKADDIARDHFRIVIFYMSHIMQKGLERQKEYRVSGGRKYKYSREHRISTERQKIYLFDDIVNYVSDNYVLLKKHYKIQCPCWEVRGHYRHYKSGKIVFVRNYKKGKRRHTEQPKAKEYVIQERAGRGHYDKQTDY